MKTTDQINFIALEFFRTKREREFNSLYQSIRPMIYYWIGAFGIEGPPKEDIFSEIMIRIWTIKDQYQETKSKPLTWIKLITDQYAINWLRKSTKIDSVTINIDDLVDDRYLPISGEEDIPDISEISEQIKKLTQIEQDLIYMVYYEGRSHRQIADILGLPLHTVKNKTSRAIKKIQKSQNFSINH